jgi:7-cyano-7-deazaguanine synthase
MHASRVEPAFFARHREPSSISFARTGVAAVSAKPKAVVLLSGGLDSTTTAAIAKNEGFAVYGLSFRYGQRHLVELDAAKKIAQQMGLEDQKTIQFDLRAFGGSALTSDIAVPKHDSTAEMEHGIPVTYVPARNTIFLSFALAWAEVLQANDIFIGVNAIDYSGYPDCRPEFIQAFQRMANIATKVGVEGTQRLAIHTPLIKLSKAQIIRRGLELGVDYSATITCYDPSPRGEGCGHCDACLLRLKGFEENGIADPAPYQKNATVQG